MKTPSAAAIATGLSLFLPLSSSAQTSQKWPAPGSASAPETASAPTKAPLANVAFLAGSWTDAAGSRASEEVWTTPSGDSMEGMWRSLADGKVQGYALASIREEAGGTVLRIRHFDAGLAPREEKALVLNLVESSERFARFEAPAAGAAGPAAIVYKRDGDMLTATLTKDGKSEEFRFRMKRWGGFGGPDRFRRRRPGEGPSS
jgi:hypothetical protein